MTKIIPFDMFLIVQIVVQKWDTSPLPFLLLYTRYGCDFRGSTDRSYQDAHAACNERRDDHETVSLRQTF